MMFLVIFGSLAACMAVVSNGNRRTANAALKVNRADSAAETGLVHATRILDEASRRFVVRPGTVDQSFATTIWESASTVPTQIEIRDYDGYPAGFVEDPPSGLIDAITNLHLAELDEPASHTFCDTVSSMAPINGVLTTCTIALEADEFGDANREGPYFQLRYELEPGEPSVLVTCTGWDQDISRTVQLSYRIQKKIEYTILTANRLMIGRGVRIEGPLGTVYGSDNSTFGELDEEHGHPIVMESDFGSLDPDLDAILFGDPDIPGDLGFYDLVRDNDSDNDGRLMINHTEGDDGGVPITDTYFDVDGDERISDFDIFLDFFDTVDQGGLLMDSVVYDADKAGMVGYPAGMEEEFVDLLGEPLDLALALMIDRAHADRDGDGIDGGPRDVELGYDDGVINASDLYAKIYDGFVRIGVSLQDWEDAHGVGFKHQDVFRGPIVPSLGAQAIMVDESLSELDYVTTDDILGLDPLSPDHPFATYRSSLTPTGPTDWVLEETPYGSDGFYDQFLRPRFVDKVYDDVMIPKGTNALFENCVFKGVTWIETTIENTHENWNIAGAVTGCGWDGTTLSNCDFKFGIPYPAMLADGTTVVEDTKTESNNIRFHNCVFIGSLTGDIPMEYTLWRNKVQFTGETRFYIDANDPALADETLAIRTAVNEVISGDQDKLLTMRKSPIFLPGISTDMGNFPGQGVTTGVNLKGTIVAGVFDFRGLGTLKGTVLTTERPESGLGALRHGGTPGNFNTTLGQFGTADGDPEGNGQATSGLVLTYDPDTPTPDNIPWRIKCSAEAETYREGGNVLVVP